LKQSQQQQQQQQQGIPPTTHSDGHSMLLGFALLLFLWLFHAPMQMRKAADIVLSQCDWYWSLMLCMATEIFTTHSDNEHVPEQEGDNPWPRVCTCSAE